MREIDKLASLKALVGAEVALSGWTTIDQRRINLFAEATGDDQWIHVDAERCARESPFGGVTVAHGFLTLSLLPGMLADALLVVDVKMGLNYGLNKVRFPAPVPVGSRLRARLVLDSVDDIDGGAQLQWSVTVERDGAAKPVCVAELLVRFYV